MLSQAERIGPGRTPQPEPLPPHVHGTGRHHRVIEVPLHANPWLSPHGNSVIADNGLRVDARRERVGAWLETGCPDAKALRDDDEWASTERRRVRAAPTESNGFRVSADHSAHLPGAPLTVIHSFAASSAPQLARSPLDGSLTPDGRLNGLLQPEDLSIGPISEGYRQRVFHRRPAAEE